MKYGLKFETWIKDNIAFFQEHRELHGLDDTRCVVSCFVYAALQFCDGNVLFVLTTTLSDCRMVELIWCSRPFERYLCV